MPQPHPQFQNAIQIAARLHASPHQVTAAIAAGSIESAATGPGGEKLFHGGQINAIRRTLQAMRDKKFLD